MNFDNGNHIRYTFVRINNLVNVFRTMGNPEFNSLQTKLKCRTWVLDSDLVWFKCYLTTRKRTRKRTERHTRYDSRSIDKVMDYTAIPADILLAATLLELNHE